MDGMTAVLDAPVVEAPAKPAGRLLKFSETPQGQQESHDRWWTNRSDKEFAGQLRAVENGSLGGGGFLLSGRLLAVIGRVLMKDSFGPDPYCLRGAKRAKIGRVKGTTS